MEESSKSVTMNTEKPVGFFSTFSIANPDGSTHANPDGSTQRSRRRNRRVFVCIPCHKRKLKCDKSQPCSRCVTSEAPGECTYQQSPSQTQEAEPLTAFRPQTQATPGTSGRNLACLEGASYWRSVAIQVSLGYYPRSHPSTNVPDR